MNSTKINLLLAAILLTVTTISIQSCKKELEINADYKAYPIVYGLLNQYESLQTIKINKSFLGDEDPKNYASVTDSSLFDSVNVSLVEFTDGRQTNSFPLQKMTLSNKEPGIFANPDNIVYGVKLPPLTPNGIKYLKESRVINGKVEERITYELRGSVNSSTDIRAELTPIPEYPTAFFLQKAFQSKWRPSSPLKISFASSTALTEGLIFTKVKIPPFVKIAELVMRFNYVDTDLNGDTTHHSIEASMGQITVPSVEETKEHETEFAISSARFFELIASPLIPDFDASKLKQRMPGPVDFTIVMGDANYYYYRENTLPTDDLNQLRPQFTNIENGFGIFVARLNITMSDWAIGTQDNITSINGMPGLLLNRTTQEALNKGYVTQTNGKEPIQLGTAVKGFCIDPTVGNIGPQICK